MCTWEHERVSVANTKGPPPPQMVWSEPKGERKAIANRYMLMASSRSAFLHKEHLFLSTSKLLYEHAHKWGNIIRQEQSQLQ